MAPNDREGAEGHRRRGRVFHGCRLPICRRLGCRCRHEIKKQVRSSKSCIGDVTDIAEDRGRRRFARGVRGTHSVCGIRRAGKRSKEPGGLIMVQKVVGTTFPSENGKPRLIVSSSVMPKTKC